MSTDKRVSGRPRIIESPEKFDELADAYFLECRENGDPYTITGLALALGFADKVTLYDYQGYDGFSYSVRRARLQVESGYEGNLHGTTPTGSIFALKNFGWSDKIEVTDARPEESARAIAEAVKAIAGSLVAD